MLPSVILINIAIGEEMFSAGISSLKNEGKMKQAKIIQVGLTNPEKIELDQQKPIEFTPEEALSLLVELDLSKSKYSSKRI